MRSIDEASINGYGIPGIVLMENAGAAAADEISRICCGKSAAVICGTGNNGGDGFVIVRHLICKGWKVKVFVCGDAGKIKGDALTNLEILINMAAEVSLATVDDMEALDSGIAESIVIVDALLGTGFKGKVSGLYEQVIDKINASGKVVVAVDMPSGLDGDTGFAGGACVRANKTVAFQLAKVGQVINQGPEYCGELITADISIPRQVIEEAGLKVNLTDMEFLASRICKRTDNTHKGTYGRVSVIAGSLGMLGAGLMSARSALKSGAGIVTLGVPKSLQAAANSMSPELMTRGLAENADGTLSKECTGQLLELIKPDSCTLFGPGLSQGPDIEGLAEHIIREAKAPLVIDADGINAISREPEILRESISSIVITPHPGEMARLMKCTASDIQGNRLAYAERFAREYGAVTVLKGFRTIVAVPDGTLHVNPTGNPGMATAGAGDVLAGIIAGLIAQGMPAADAAVCGVYIHGAAGDAAAQKIGEYGLTASDIIEFVPHTIKNIAGK